MTVRADDKEFRARVRLDTPREREYLRHGGILPYVLRRLLVLSSSSSPARPVRARRRSPRQRRATDARPAAGREGRAQGDARVTQLGIAGATESQRARRRRLRLAWRGRARAARAGRLTDRRGELRRERASRLRAACRPRGSCRCTFRRRPRRCARVSSTRDPHRHPVHYDREAADEISSAGGRRSANGCRCRSAVELDARSTRRSLARPGRGSGGDRLSVSSRGSSLAQCTVLE